MKVCSLPAAGTLAVAAIIGSATLQASAGGLQPQGGEFPLTRGIPGDQVNPGIVLDAGGGWLVWQDAAIDGQGLGIAATRLGPEGTAPTGATLRVNATVAGDQENAAICRVGDRGAFVAWQTGTLGFQRIAGRVLAGDGTFASAELAISSGGGEHQIDPAVATLEDGSVIVVWSSYRQDESYAYDVFARRYSAAGIPLGEEFRVNATTGMSRRTPAVTGRADGGFVAAWISERQAGTRNNLGEGGVGLAGAGMAVYEVAVVVRAFDANGTPVGGEQKISDPRAIASNPVLSTFRDGHLLAAWTRRDPDVAANRLDVASRFLNSFGLPEDGETLVNVTTFGDQYRPRLSPSSHGVLAVWSSMGQDGSWEGVYGRWFDESGQPVGDEIPINGQTGGGQLFPTIAADDGANLLVAWSSNLPRTGYELFGQRFAPLLLSAAPSGPGALRLSWPTVAGGIYQLQSTQDGRAWSNLGGARTAFGGADAVEMPVAGQMVLYRVIRSR